MTNKRQRIKRICSFVDSVSVGIRGIYGNHKSRYFVIALLAILEFSIILTHMYVVAIK